MAPIYKMLALLALTISLKVIEHANKIEAGQPQAKENGEPASYLLKNLSAGYAVLNLQLSLSIGSLGVVWGSLTQSKSGAPIFFVSIAIVLCALLGAISRGLVARGTPQAMKWSDWDWRFGVMIPNGFGFAAVIVSTGYQLW